MRVTRSIKAQQWHHLNMKISERYEPELAAVSTGSHIDAIPYSGKYDGVLGVLGCNRSH